MGEIQSDNREELKAKLSEKMLVNIEAKPHLDLKRPWSNAKTSAQNFKEALALCVSGEESKNPKLKPIIDALRAIFEYAASLERADILVIGDSSRKPQPDKDEFRYDYDKPVLRRADDIQLILAALVGDTDPVVQEDNDSLLAEYYLTDFGFGVHFIQGKGSRYGGTELALVAEDSPAAQRLLSHMAAIKQ